MKLSDDETLPETCRGIESRHPGWHVYISDTGRPWAVTTRPAGSGTTFDTHKPGEGEISLTAGLAVIEQVIAAYDYAMEHGHDPWRTTETALALARAQVLNGTTTPALGGAA